MSRNQQWIAARGKFLLENDRIVIGLGFDFINYYSFLIENSHKVSYDYPKWGGHITLTNSKLHKGVDYSLAKKFEKTWVNFEYNPDVMVGGQSKGFKLFWMKVRSQQIEDIKRVIGVIDDSRFLGLHISLASTKSSGGRKFQKKMIEVRQLKNNEDYK